MRKQVRLPDSVKNKDLKKDAQTERKKGGFVLFVRDQGEGMGRTWVIILKVLEIILTTIFPFILGIFVPVIFWNDTDFIDTENVVIKYIANAPFLVWWLISSCVYIVGLFAVMLGRAKTAAVIHTIAAAGTLVTYSLFREMESGLVKEVVENTEGSHSVTLLFMPSLFITLFTIFIMLIINVPKWYRSSLEKANRKAPSILEDKKAAVPKDEPLSPEDGEE